MTQAYILAGSNLGERKANLDFAVASLGKGGSVTRISSCFETEPVGYLDQPWFLNQAVELETLLAPPELLSLCQSIETAAGRVRTFANAPRTLDLDILLFGDVVLNRSDLVIPHPRLAERRFALEPLAQIAPDFIHPVLKLSIKDLGKLCRDTSLVRVFA